MYLMRLGYVVEMPGRWESRAQFCVRIGISKRTFNRRIRSRWLPQADIKRGPTGRLICLRSNSIFDQFMRRRWGQIQSGDRKAETGK